MRIFLTALLTLIMYEQASAQPFQFSAQVKDSHNEEAIPFASVIIYPGKGGTLTDSLGFFSISGLAAVPDSLIITYVGYEPRHILKQQLLTQNNTVIYLERQVTGGVIIRHKANWGLILWRKVVRRKDENDRTRFANYGYEVHNKLELDLNKVKADKLDDIKLFKPFRFILDNIDTTEGAPFLPVFLTETLSDYYYQKDPKRYREIIKASKTNGINNESVTQLLGGMYQNVNVYNNFIQVFDKQFVSPLSNHGDQFYTYQVADTVELNGRKFFHWLFSPKHHGTNTFYGDAWIHDSTFAVQRIQLRIDDQSTVNHIQNLSIYQDYIQLNDSTWFLSKDKFIADVSPLGKNRSGLKGRKTTTYRDVIFNSDSVEAMVKQNRIAEEVIVLPTAEKMPETFWTSSRHEALSKNETAIYKMVDTLQQMPLFKKYSSTISFLGSGYKAIGNYEIGPWFNWISGNRWEGFRTRFDLGTTPGFHRNIYLHGYLAYGFKDEKFKGKAEMYYVLKRDPRHRLHVVYQNDLDNGQNYYGEVTFDNIFALAVRKSGVPVKFLKIQTQEIEYMASTRYGLQLKTEMRRRLFTPLLNLPGKENYTPGKGDIMNSFETSFSVRFAYLEKFLNGKYFRVSLGSAYPIGEIKYVHGFSGVLKSNYKYDKLSLRINGFKNLPPLGSIDYSLYGGKIFGTLPYILLDIAPGNEIYYYNKYAFNLMNRFEYITDQYAGVSLEHNIGNGLFKYIPITRKLKFRQFYNFRSLWGSLSEANKTLNFVGNHPFQDLTGKMYAEVGTGIDNILKVLRVDFVWRLGPRPLPENKVYRFGTFFSFRLAF